MKQNNSNAAHLTPHQVQQVHALHRMSFTSQSIALVFNVCGRSVRDILKGRSWRHVQPERVELPLFDPDLALCLRLRGWHRLTDEQRHEVEQYSNALAAQVEDQREREALTAALLDTWKPRRVVRRRITVPAAAAVEVEGPWGSKSP